MLNSHNHVLSLLFEKPLVFGPNPGIDSLGQLPSVGFESHQFLLQVFFAAGQIRQTTVNCALGFIGGLRSRGDLPLSGFSLFHQFQLLILEPDDYLFAVINFVTERAVLFILLGLKLLERIFFNLLLFGVDIQFELFPV